MLGCPNLPQSQIQDEDGACNSAAKAGTDGVGVIFAAQRGAGAFAGPLAGAPCNPLLPARVFTLIGP